MFIFAHEGHEHSEAMTHSSSDDPLTTIIIIGVVVAVVVGLAVFFRSRDKK